MIMDPKYTGFSDEFTSFQNFNHTPVAQTQNPSFDLDFITLSDLDAFDPQDEPFGESVESLPDWNQASDDRESSDPVLKYISQMLLEENMEDKPHMFYDPMALQATEQSLFDVLGHQTPDSLNHDTPDSTVSTNSSDYGASTNTSTSTSTSDSLDPHFIADVPGLQTSRNGLPEISQGSVGVGEMVQNMFRDADSVLLFQRGLEEASKFLPKPSNLVINLETNEVVLEKNEDAASNPNSNSPDGSRGKKNHEREYSDLEQERSRKQSVVYVEEEEISEQFDKVLLWPGMKGGQWCCTREVKHEPEEQTNGSKGAKTRGKKQGKKKETVDLRSLLLLCAQAVSTNDLRTSNELLKQIRQHSSPLGDSFQRLAHYFANGLEARMAGICTGMPTFHTYIISKRLSAAEMLKSYKTHMHYIPFKKLSILYANKMILKAAENAETLHIIDFGVMYGFQWPILIQLLSMQPNGPPKLRVTGIELPQHGFRPAERIIETGRRLAQYCERFNVPFEYNPIATQKWESIPIEDLKIRKGEVVAVNCLARFKNLLDETAGDDCPRDEILDLIRRIKPDIFVHCIANGSYNAPFFLTRFREALFHFSSLFDMFDSVLPRENAERMMFEREFYGREAINVVACEGAERVERPETYKQWQSRTLRAGFKQMPLDREVVEKCVDKMQTWYHKDFVIDEDNEWMLQGWKGRIVYASSCWVPS